MKVGTINLFDKYKRNHRAVADAYVRGEITPNEEPYMWDIINPDDIEAAKERLPREEWKPTDRIKQLENEVEVLKRRIAQLERHHV